MLQVGRTYRTRCGSTVTIAKIVDHPVYPYFGLYKGTIPVTYTKDGRFSINFENASDIIIDLDEIKFGR